MRNVIFNKLPQNYLNVYYYFLHVYYVILQTVRLHNSVKCILLIHR